MTGYRFQVGENQADGKGFREELRLAGIKMCYAHRIERHSGSGNEIYNIPADKATLVLDYSQHFHRSGNLVCPQHFDEKGNFVLITYGVIEAPDPRKVAGKLEKLTKIKLVPIRK